MLPLTAIWILNFETVEIRLEYPILRNVSNMSEESAESLLHVYF